MLFGTAADVQQIIAANGFRIRIGKEREGKAGFAAKLLRLLGAINADRDRKDEESKASGKRSTFTLVLGTSGNLRGIPVQIRFQPNWWFQVVLNLCPAAPQAQGN